MIYKEKKQKVNIVEVLNELNKQDRIRIQQQSELELLKSLSDSGYTFKISQSK